MWYFKGIEFNLSDYEKSFGFVYLITELNTGKMYIGQKQFWSKKIKVVKGNKKKVKCESDWQTYFSSSSYIQEEIKQGKIDNFKREILILTTGKGQSNYLEAKLQMDCRVLETPDIFLNGIINLRCSTGHLKLETVIDQDSDRINLLMRQSI